MKINTAEAKNRFSEIIRLLQTKQEEEILIANRGTVIVRMVLFDDAPKRRLGLAKGKWEIPDDIDECNDEIAEMFGVDA